jgi:hypothetical protein
MVQGSSQAPVGTQPAGDELINAVQEPADILDGTNGSQEETAGRDTHDATQNEGSLNSDDPDTLIMPQPDSNQEEPNAQDEMTEPSMQNVQSDPETPTAPDSLKAEPNSPISSDELSGYYPCSGTGDGSAKFSQLIGHYDERGRYVLLTDFEGTLGSIKLRDFENPGNNMTASSYIDISGRHSFAMETLNQRRPGPVRIVRFGKHRGFLRISLSYHDSRKPKGALLEVLCSGQRLALRLTLDPQGPITAEPFAQDIHPEAK